MNKTSIVALTLCSALPLMACKGAGASAPAGNASQPAGAGASLTVTLQAKSGSTLSGTATFTDDGSGVAVIVEVAGVAPGKHGMHIHETPDCTAEDASSAGTHYNPHGKEHSAAPGAGHIGDLGNIDVAEDGKGRLEVTIAGANLKGGDASSFRERAIIIHTNADDGSQPTGNAGGRIGCGVIR